MKLTLHGEFVDLRPLQPEDAALTLAWRQSTRAVNLNRGAQTVAQQAVWIASRPAGEYNFVITLKNGLPVGTLSLVDVDTEHQRAEPGRFLIGDEAAVRGIPAAAEAMKLLYGLAFDQLGLQRVHGCVASDNTLMLKWQKFLGMREEGRLRQHLFINGHFQDSVMIGMLAQEYREVALPRLKMMISAGQKAAGAASE
jgi:diamine N-acetyltransferase